MVLAIYGAGGAGREAKEIAEIINQWEELVFIDDTEECCIYKNIKKLPFDQFEQIYSPQNTEIIIALGEPQYKKMLYDKVVAKGYALANVIHPAAIINKSATLGHGLLIKAGAIVSSDAVVEDNVSIEEYAVVGHDTIVRKHSQLSTFSVIAGHCEIGESTYIALSVPVKEMTRIGSNVVVGMGSVVVRDIPDDVIAMGNPARAIKRSDGKKVVGK